MNIVFAFGLFWWHMEVSIEKLLNWWSMQSRIPLGSRRWRNWWKHNWNAWLISKSSEKHQGSLGKDQEEEIISSYPWKWYIIWKQLKWQKKYQQRYGKQWISRKNWSNKNNKHKNKHNSKNKGRWMRNLALRWVEWLGKMVNCRLTYRMLDTQTFLLARL